MIRDRVDGGLTLTFHCSALTQSDQWTAHPCFSHRNPLHHKIPGCGGRGDK